MNLKKIIILWLINYYKSKSNIILMRVFVEQIISLGKLIKAKIVLKKNVMTAGKYEILLP